MMGPALDRRNFLRASTLAAVAVSAGSVAP